MIYTICYYRNCPNCFSTALAYLNKYIHLHLTPQTAYHQIFVDSLEAFFAIVIICIDHNERGINHIFRYKHSLSSSPSVLYGLPEVLPEYR